MPEDAYTSLATIKKLRDFPILLNTHITNFIAANDKNTPYVYVDLNSGDGKNYIKALDETFDGSFYTAYNLMKAAGLVNWHLLGFETEYQYYRSLVVGMTNLHEPEPQRIEVFNTNNIYARSKIVKFGNCRGLAYCDPIGYFQVDTLQSISDEFPNIDILINANCAQFKRSARRGDGAQVIRLIDRLMRINKQYWFIGAPRAKQQWSFVYGTNNIETIAGVDHLLSRIDDGAEGTARFNIVNLTAVELTGKEKKVQQAA